MSVQAGTWNYTEQPMDWKFLANASSSLSEFGPDSEVTYFDGPIGMLYRGSHTTTESRTERQPYITPGKNVITWDGILDNREDLLHQLKDDLASDHTDVALVAAAFDRWGTDCLARFIGDWGLAIWDPQNKELILARDYLGVRHLFYYPGLERILWCNHLSPLAACGDRFTLCDEYIAGYLALHPEAHLTPYREIRSVPPGKFVRISPTEISIHGYGKFDVRSPVRYRTNAEYEEHYRHLFRQAVRRRLRSDSPVLSELSGGLDSSSIVCMADSILAHEGGLTPRLDTFSYYDSNEPEEDDLHHLVKIETKRGRQGFRVDLQGVGDSLPLEYSVFSPTPGFGSRAEIKLPLSELLRRREHRVVLCGLGGDEMNGQPLNPRLLMADLLVDLRWKELGQQLIAWSLLTRKPLLHLLFGTLAQFLPARFRSKLSKEGMPELWTNKSFARKHKLALRQMGDMNAPWFFRPGVRESAEALIAIGRQLTCIGPSITEQRYPYLDQNLVEFLSAIPLDQFLQPGERRFLMRRALKDIVPPEILARKTKASASRCYAISLEKHWTMIESVLSTPLSERLGYINKEQMSAALMAMRHGRSPTHLVRLFKALSLEYWLRDIESRGVISIPSSEPWLLERHLATSSH